MSLPSGRSPSLTRIAAGLVALGLPLLGASAAQAAMGTSQTLSTANINRPILTSVTAQGDTGLVTYCFATPGNQAITHPPVGFYGPNNFWIGGYEQEHRLAPVSIEQESNQCLQATFDQGQRTQYTYGGVLDDAVVAIVSGNPIGNEEDGAPLNGSESHNGTRGLSTGPDLQTVARPGSNRMAFVFDQNVDEDAFCDGPPCGTGDFWFYDQSGELHGDIFSGANGGGPLVVSVSDNVVVVQYRAANGDAVADATVAAVDDFASAFSIGFGSGGPLLSDTPDGDTFSRRTVLLSVVVPGSSGTTDEINLVSAALVNGGESNQVVFTFDKGPVSLTDEEPRFCYHVNLSNANREYADSATASGNAVTATFSGGDGGFQLLSEMGVSASVQGENCVESQSGQVPNNLGGKPIGGNVGAFGTGYTNGPDALGLSRSGGDMIVRVDQRVDPDEFLLGNVCLVNSQGAPFACGPSSASVSGNGSPTATHRVTFSFDPVAAASAAGMQLVEQAMETFEGDDEFSDGQDNVSQVFGLGGLT